MRVVSQGAAIVLEQNPFRGSLNRKEGNKLESRSGWNRHESDLEQQIKRVVGKAKSKLELQASTSKQQSAFVGNNQTHSLHRINVGAALLASTMIAACKEHWSGRKFIFMGNKTRAIEKFMRAKKQLSMS